MNIRASLIGFALVLSGAASAHAMQGPPPPPPPPPPPANFQVRTLPFKPPTGGSAQIAGRVMSDDKTPVPLRRVVVTLRSDAYTSGWTMITGDNGTFDFGGLPSGRYTLSASKPSFVSTTYGALRPGRPGTPIYVVDGGHVTNVALTLMRGAVITGVVRDEHGLPMENMQVTAAPIVTRNGARATTAATSSLIITDDRGEYRLFGLAPGEYAVSVEARFVNLAAPGGFRVTTAAAIDAAIRPATAGAATPPVETDAAAGAVTLASVYYPGAVRLDDATPVKVAAGEERRGVDVSMQYVASASVRGRLLDASGKVPENVSLTMVAPGVVRPQFAFPSPADGSFLFGGVTPGRYVITARATPNSAPGGSAATLFARADIDVNGQPINGINLTLTDGAKIAGSVAFDSSTGAPPPTARVILSPVLRPGEISIGVPGPATTTGGTFEFVGVTPGKYRVSVLSVVAPSAAGSGWSLKSATINNTDAIDEGFEVRDSDLSGLAITLSDKVTEIAGSFEDAKGRAAPDYYVIVFPTDQKYWFLNSRRIKMTRPSADGKFVLRDLPPGEYRIAAVTDVETNEWFEPSFLQQLVAASATLTLADGEKKSFPLKIGSPVDPLHVR